MRNFEYVQARSLDEVMALRQSDPETRLLAGGTDLLVQMRERRREVTYVVDIKAVPEMTELAYDPTRGLTVGAAVPCYRIYEEADIALAYPCLIDSASLIGGVGIQGRATLGGNMCNASPAADAIPSLIVLGAVCRVTGPRGERRIPAEQFCAGPGRNALEVGEFLVAFEIPPPKPRSGARFLRFIPRNEMDIAVVNAAASLELTDDGTIGRARVAIGAVAPTPLLVEEAAAALQGQLPTPKPFEAAAAAARDAAKPITDMRGTASQRRHLVGVLTRRALDGALERARMH